MKRILILVLAILIFLMANPFPTLAYSVGVSPGSISAVNIPLGEKVIIDDIHVVNSNNTTCTFSIRTMLPVILRTGYEAIPNITWVTVDKNQVTVEPYLAEPVNVYVRIPSGKGHANKNYECWVVISGSEGGNIIVEVAVRVFISTGVWIGK